MTLNHVHLGTKNLSQCMNFYETLFGFKKKFQHGDGVFMENQNGFLIAVDPVEKLPEFPSWYHLGFCLDSEQKVLDMYQKVKSFGANIARDLAREPGEFASFFILDPDGNRLEISWHNE